MDKEAAAEMRDGKHLSLALSSQKSGVALCMLWVVLLGEVQVAFFKSFLSTVCIPTPDSPPLPVDTV